MRDFTLIRTQRKTLALKIRKDGAVEVRAPLRCPKTIIDKFVSDHEDWIVKKMEIIDEKLRQKEEFSINEHTKLLLLGREFPVAFGNVKRVQFMGDRFWFPESMPEKLRLNALIGFYKKAAREHLTSRVDYFSTVIGVNADKVSITSARTRWGSCSSRGTVSFSWRLMLAYEGAIDYVVVHELCHRLEMNHSALFWAHVAGVLPDYKQRQKVLKIIQSRVDLY